MTNKSEMVRLLRLAWGVEDVSAADCRKIDAILAATAEDVCAVVDEPVADVVLFRGEKIIDGTLAYMATAKVGDRLYRHPQRPVVMPERRQWSGLHPTAENLKAEGWNACLDEIARLNP